MDHGCGSRTECQEQDTHTQKQRVQIQSDELACPPNDTVLVAMYAADVVRIKPGALAKVSILPFDQGPHGEYMILTIPANT